MQARTTGLILRTYPLTETSLIVHWLTSDLGRIATVAKGARRPKSQFQGKLDLFYLADFSFHRSRRSELHTLREVSLCEIHSALREDLAHLQQAAYASALIEQTTETETPLPQIFQLFRCFLAHLVTQPAQPLNIFAFEIKLLHELGLMPDFRRTKLSAGSQQLLGRLIEMDWTALPNLKLSEAQAHAIRRFLHEFLIYHLGKIPKGREESVAAK
jgi:DNA repair protein RecO (recombination protein O)